ncbi:MAG: hypothetical protein GEU94_15675 [Micromonosporaceae bacterium]|nr:hypothetical protein [Micromonosporaceae bacterium]
MAWLEAGWSENGWRSGRGQVVYTYDSQAGEWVFHERYPIADGDRIWIHLESASGRATGAVEWTAWLWWRGEWRELATVSLPAGGRAQVEEFVEVHVDGRAGGAFAVPRIEVDNVWLRGGDGESSPWRGEVDTAVADSRGRYCVDWRQRYDTWSAGDC